MAHVNSYGVHYPLWLDSTAGSIGWGLPPFNYQREGTFFGNILAKPAPWAHGSLSAPLGYYCEGPGVTGGSLVAGRMGTTNAQSAAPFYNSYLGSSCDASIKCNAHKPDGVNIDGYNSCADNGGNAFSNTLTVWRDPTVLPVFDANYVYSVRTATGSAGLAMTVQNGNYSNGNPLIQWRYRGTNKFRIVDSGAGNGSFQIASWENQGMCLDNPGGQTANGTQVQLYGCQSNDPWQQWMISVDTSTSAAYLKNVGSGKCLDDTGSTAAGTVPWIWDCNTTNVNQKWRMAGGFWNPGSNGSASFINDHPVDAYVMLAGNGNGNVALDTGGNYSNGAHPSLNTGIDTNKDDKFMILPGTSPNTWTIKSQWNSGMCVDNPGNQTANGTAIQLWSCNGGSNQNWIISNRPNGGVQIQNQQSNKCLFNQWAMAPNNGVSMVIQDCDVTNGGEVWQLTAN